MKNITYQHSSGRVVTLPHILNPSGNKLFYVFGDSFSGTSDATYLNSWLTYVSDYFDAKIINYGIPGASESSIFYAYYQTISFQRDFDIIFHTNPARIDNRFLSVPITKTFYKKWDEFINKPCLHLYWSDSFYDFKNGDKLSCQYLYDDSFYNIHHMSYKDNKLFAQEVIEKIKESY